MNKKKVLLALMLSVAIVGAVAWVGTTLSQQKQSIAVTQNSSSAPTLIIDDARVIVAIADTPEKRQQGLSGSESLAPDHGMFFIFPASDRYSIWMPDMHYAIDVLWFDEQLHVVYIVEHMTPESYPAIFTPTTPARYILEVPDGFVANHGVRVGDHAVTTNILSAR